MLEIYGNYSSDVKFADLHMHTSRSDGIATPFEVVEMAVAAKRLSALAITDHEVIDPAFEAREYCLKMGYPLEIIIGTEITTSKGHLIGLFLTENIPSGKAPEWTIQQIHAQGGLAIAAHPMYAWTRSLKKDTLLHIMNNPDADIYLDGFEIFNAGVGDNPRTKANENAKLFYEEYPDLLGAAIGSSDGHFHSVGRGLTGYSGDLYEAIKNRQTSVFTLEQDEQFNLFYLAQNLFNSMVKETARRIQRYARIAAKKKASQTHEGD